MGSNNRQVGLMCLLCFQDTADDVTDVEKRLMFEPGQLGRGNIFELSPSGLRLILLHHARQRDFSYSNSQRQDMN